MKEFLKLYHIHIIIGCFYIAMIWTWIETYLICVKDKMTIDYIFEYLDKRKARKEKKKKCDSGTET